MCASEWTLLALSEALLTLLWPFYILFFKWLYWGNECKYYFNPLKYHTSKEFVVTCLQELQERNYNSIASVLWAMPYSTMASGSSDCSAEGGIIMDSKCSCRIRYACLEEPSEELVKTNEQRLIYGADLGWRSTLEASGSFQLRCWHRSG